jgi:hypothetical protein
LLSFPLASDGFGFQLNAIDTAAIDEHRHAAPLVPCAGERLARAVSFNARAAFQVNPDRLVVVAVLRRRFRDGFTNFKVIVVVRALHGRSFRCYSFDLFDFFFWQKITEVALAVPNTLRSLGCFVYDEGRTIR